MSDGLSRKAVDRLLDAGAGFRPKRSDRYRILKEIGRGGIGVVYLAKDRTTGAKVALKVLSERVQADGRMAERFRREGVALMALHHPHVARCVDASDDFIVMEYLKGHLLSEKPVRDPRRLAPILIDVAHAVHAAHKKGILHRDLKPANLMLVKGHVYVLDFGLTRTPDLAVSNTRTGRIVGTPGYMSPEQARGVPVDARSDVYSLGATLYDLVAGHPPFFDQDLDHLLKRVHEEAPPPLAKVAKRIDAQLDAIAMRCLERAPERRFQNALEFGHALHAWWKSR